MLPAIKTYTGAIAKNIKISVFMRLTEIIANTLTRYFRKDSLVVFAVVLVG